MFRLYILKEQSDRANIEDLEISLHALAVMMIKKRGENFLCDSMLASLSIYDTFYTYLYSLYSPSYVGITEIDKLKV